MGPNFSKDPPIKMIPQSYQPHLQSYISVVAYMVTPSVQMH